jgi:hypothetical protein
VGCPWDRAGFCDTPALLNQHYQQTHRYTHRDTHIETTHTHRLKHTTHTHTHTAHTHTQTHTHTTHTHTAHTHTQTHTQTHTDTSIVQRDSRHDNNINMQSKHSRSNIGSNMHTMP